MISVRHRATLGAALLVSAACQWMKPAANPTPNGDATATVAARKRVALVKLEDRPPLALVAREGDPLPAMAFAAAHDHGSRASTALAALMEARLGRHGFIAAESRAHDVGFHVATLLDSAGDAPRFARAVAQALSAPIAPGEPALGAVRARWAALRARAFVGPGEAAAAACSGDPGVLTSDAERAEPTISELETWRRAVHSARASAFAALGDRRVLAAARGAIEALETWPTESVPDDPWPASDLTAVDPASDLRRLSVALRLPNAAVAIETARALGKPNGSLGTRLSAFEPSWTLERVVGTARPRGACLRIDARAARGEPAVSIADVARVAAIVEEEAERARARAQKRPASLESGVLEPSDPRDAAAIAAWQSLSGKQSAGPRRRVIAYAGRGGAAESSALARELAALERAAAEPTLELRTRVEPGQGHAWVLLASTCGTSGETDGEAGAGALAMRALASRAPQAEVVIEPWITPDGLGLLAHARRIGPDESAENQVRRIAATLARTVLTRLSGREVADVRDRLLVDLGPAPGYWTAIEALAPHRPSWLEPRGTWTAVSGSSTHGVERERRAWLRSPLRVAVIANHDPAQARAAHDELERWLRPLRGSITSCQNPERPAARTGEITLESSEGAEPRASAYVAAPIAPGPPPEAWMTELLLNRPRGWLEQALNEPGLTGGARARVVGGQRAAALVIELGSFEDRAPQAVQQVRALLERLSRGGVRASDFELARAELARVERRSSLDPRRRIVDLWLGKQARTPTLESLARFQRTLAPSSHLVVFVKTRD